MGARGKVGIVHELSRAGRRPLCGAEPEVEPARRDAAQRVTCRACLRLLEDDARLAAHRRRPRVDESED